MDNLPPIKNSHDSNQDLKHHIESEKEKSFDYQILNKLLIDQTENKKKSDEQQHDKLELSYKSKQLSKIETIETSQQEFVVAVSTSSSLKISSQNTSQVSPPPQSADPLAFDLDGNGIQTTGIKNGAIFDINADGKNEKTSFITGNDAFLAYDKNGNGIIDNGSELFGDQNGAANGYEELKKYDDNQDGKINANDQIYNKLSLLSFNDKQIKTEPLSNHISEIDLDYQQKSQAINEYDQITQQSKFTNTDGTTGQSSDILVSYRDIKN
ncbi:MAG: hypothetical protein HQL46_15230 [Gammaproteobacteria bacterium]|nr:hypothetical protein [Gammaproteobacteria bacterium]